MKKILATALLALLAASCVQDNGNYDYRNPDDVFPVKIAGFPIGETVQQLKQGDHFTLDVTKQVTGIEPGRYTYIWVAQQPKQGGGTNEREISRTKQGPNLDIDIAPLGTGSYTLVLEVRDEALNLYRRSAGVKIEIGAGFGYGYYVLKNTGTGFVNVDYVSTIESDGTGAKDPETGLDAPQQIPNAIAGGELPQGEGVGIAYIPLYAIDRPKLDAEGNPTGALEYVLYSASYGYATGVIKKSNMGAFFVGTKNNVWTIDPLDMTPIRSKWEDEFFNTDGVPRNVENMLLYDADFTGKGAASAAAAPVCYLILDGKVYYLSLAMHNYGVETGRFIPRLESAGNDYSIAPFIARNNTGADMSFDKLTHSFLWGYSFSMSKWNSPVEAGSHGDKGFSQPAGMPNLSNMPYDLVWLINGNRRNSAMVAALMKSTTSNTYTLLLSTSESKKDVGAPLLVTSNYIANTYPFERQVAVDPASKLISSAQQFMVHGSSNVYFALGNKIYWHLTGGSDIGKEEELFTLPADETIVSTQLWQKVPQSIDHEVGTTSVLVLSNSSTGKWHLRRFKLTEGEAPLNNIEIAALNNKPEFHTSGTGTAVGATYRGDGYQLQNK